MQSTRIIENFEKHPVRAVWENEEQKWYYSVIDVVVALTDSKDPRQYIKKMRKRDPYVYENWRKLAVLMYAQTPGGIQETNFSNRESLFRIMQAIPSKKVESFKQWLLKVSAKRP